MRLRSALRAIAAAVATTVARAALAHHGADPAAELPWWAIVTIAVVVLFGYIVTGYVRKHMIERERREPNAASRPHEHRP